MLFFDTFTVPAGTSRSDPVSRQIKVDRGIIHLVEVAFLDGPENEVSVTVRRGLHQIVPTSPDGAVVGNAATVSAHLFEPMERAPYHVVIEAWSPSADYDHEVTVRVHILPRNILLPPSESEGILKRLQALIFGGR